MINSVFMFREFENRKKTPMGLLFHIVVSKVPKRIKVYKGELSQPKGVERLLNYR